MAFCPTCGATINEGASFCGNCGASTGKAAPPPSPPPSSGVPGNAPDIITRVTGILTKPKEEWPVIAGEATSPGALYSGYIAILAAIPILANLIGVSFLGRWFMGTHFGLIGGLLAAIVQYVLSLAGVYVAAIVIEKLAPSFHSSGGTLQALKLVAYASTALWVAGVCHILPIIGALGVLAGAIYSIYLFYLGLPAMMKTPSDKVVPYMIVSAVVIIVIHVIIGFVVAILAASAFFGGRALTGGF